MVRSNVYDDAVAIGGEQVGSSGPEAHAVAPGCHLVTVTKRGYGRWDAVVEVAAGETKIARAKLVKAGVAAESDRATWDETVAFVRGKLRDHWARGDPPSGFDANEESAAFRVRNPADASVWHHYSLDLRDIEVLLAHNAPSAVTLRCLKGDRCIHQEMCRNDQCFEEDFTSQQTWFFEDSTQGIKVLRALNHLIDMAVRRFPAKGRDGELF